MLTLYTSASPNGRRVSIALEELALPYELRVLDLGAAEQLDREFLAKSPNHTVPLIEDGDLVLWESGAILVHLAERHGDLLPSDPMGRARAMQYAFFASSAVGPNLERLLAQLRLPIEERSRDIVESVGDEVSRLLEALGRMLEDGRPFLAEAYSIADIMHFPWMQPLLSMRAPPLMEQTRVVAWLERVAARPAVVRGMAVPR